MGGVIWVGDDEAWAAPGAVVSFPAADILSGHWRDRLNGHDDLPLVVDFASLARSLLREPESQEVGCWMVEDGTQERLYAAFRQNPALISESPSRVMDLVRLLVRRMEVLDRNVFLLCHTSPAAVCLANFVAVHLSLRRHFTKQPAGRADNAYLACGPILRQQSETSGDVLHVRDNPQLLMRLADRLGVFDRPDERINETPGWTSTDSRWECDVFRDRQFDYRVWFETDYNQAAVWSIRLRNGMATFLPRWVAAQHGLSGLAQLVPEKDLHLSAETPAAPMRDKLREPRSATPNDACRLVFDLTRVPGDLTLTSPKQSFISCRRESAGGGTSFPTEVSLNFRQFAKIALMEYYSQPAYGGLTLRTNKGFDCVEVGAIDYEQRHSLDTIFRNGANDEKGQTLGALREVGKPLKDWDIVDEEPKGCFRIRPGVTTNIRELYLGTFKGIELKPERKNNGNRRTFELKELLDKLFSDPPETPVAAQPQAGADGNAAKPAPPANAAPAPAKPDITAAKPSAAKAVAAHKKEPESRIIPAPKKTRPAARKQ